MPTGHSRDRSHPDIFSRGMTDPVHEIEPADFHVFRPSSITATIHANIQLKILSGLRKKKKRKEKIKDWSLN